MNISITVNSESESDLQEAATLIELLRSRLVKPDLMKIVGAVASDNYGWGRLGYLKKVAEAGDAGVSIDDLVANHFKGSFQAAGGTHASIEKTWRAKGGEAFAPAMIYDSDDGKRHVMTPEARELVIALVELVEMEKDLEPDEPQ